LERRGGHKKDGKGSLIKTPRNQRRYRGRSGEGVSGGRMKKKKEAHNSVKKKNAAWVFRERANE